MVRRGVCAAAVEGAERRVAELGEVAGFEEGVEEPDVSDAYEMDHALWELIDIGCVALQQPLELLGAARSFVHHTPE